MDMWAVYAFGPLMNNAAVNFHVKILVRTLLFLLGICLAGIAWSCGSYD